MKTAKTITITIHVVADDSETERALMQAAMHTIYRGVGHQPSQMPLVAGVAHDFSGVVADRGHLNGVLRVEAE